MPEDLNKLSVEDLGKLFPIVLSEHNPGWGQMFQEERELILDYLGTTQIVNIEHIGSTSVPGLIAKSTIDILIEINNDSDIDEIVTKLESGGYTLIPKPENPPPHLMFAKGYSVTGYTGQTFHIHIRYQGDCEEIIFRDYLIKNPSTAIEYSELKRRLSVSFTNDREKYTLGKTDFIKDILKRAEEELKNKPYF
jgi:GrpB-like predicted nucleotidyltransferase (UPF0157 family)